MTMLKESNGVKRLVANANTIEEAIAAVSGGEPLNAREQAIIQAVTEVLKRDKSANAKANKTTFAFNHDAGEVYDAVGVEEEFWEALDTKLTKTLRMMNDDETESYTSQSTKLEALMKAFDSDKEIILAFYMWAHGTNQGAIAALHAKDIEIKALKYELMNLRGKE